MKLPFTPGGLRWTLLSFALIALLVWISVVLLLRAATPAVSDLMVGLSGVLNAGADTMDESSEAVERSRVLMSGIEPGLGAMADGLDASAESLRGTRAAVAQIAEVFTDLGISLEEAGVALSLDPRLRQAGQELADTGASMQQAAVDLAAVNPELDALVREIEDVKEVVLSTADNTAPLVGSLGRTRSALTETGSQLRGSAGQVDAVRESGSLRFALVMLFVLLGTISISLAVIAGSRLTQLGLVQQVAESASTLPQTAGQAARRVGGTLERGRTRQSGE